MLPLKLGLPAVGGDSPSFAQMTERKNKIKIFNAVKHIEISSV